MKRRAIWMLTAAAALATSASAAQAQAPGDPAAATTPPPIAPPPPAAPPVYAPPPGAASPPAGAPAAAPSPPPVVVERKASWALLGLGIGGVVVGGALVPLGAALMGEAGRSEETVCPNSPSVCYTHEQDVKDEFGTGQILVGVGAGCLGAGLAMLILGIVGGPVEVPASSAMVPRVDVGPGRLTAAWRLP